MNGTSGLNGAPIPGVAISGSGSAFPEELGRSYTNEDLHELVHGRSWKSVFDEKGWDPEYFQKKYGFQKRFWVHPVGTPLSGKEPTSADLMEVAAKAALNDAGIVASELDLLIAVSTTSPKYTTSLGAILGGKLGLLSASFEMKAGCSSSLYAIVIGSQFIASGARNVLIVAGETLSKIAGLQPSVLYSVGDGAGALVLSRKKDSDSGILSWYLDSNGKYTTAMGVPGILPPIAEGIPEAYRFQYGEMPEEFLQNAWKASGNFWKGVNISSPEYLIPHQVNRNLIRLAAESAGIPEDRILDLVGEIANCGSSSLLVALDRYRKKIARERRTVLLSAAGGGISWGGILLRT